MASTVDFEHCKRFSFLFSSPELSGTAHWTWAGIFSLLSAFFLLSRLDSITSYPIGHWIIGKFLMAQNTTEQSECPKCLGTEDDSMLASMVSRLALDFSCLRRLTQNLTTSAAMVKGNASSASSSRGAKKPVRKDPNVAKDKDPPREVACMPLPCDDGVSCRMCGMSPDDDWPLSYPTEEERMWQGKMVWLKGKPGFSKGRYDKLCWSVYSVGGYMNDHGALSSYHDKCARGLINHGEFLDSRQRAIKLRNNNPTKLRLRSTDDIQAPKKVEFEKETEVSLEAPEEQFVELSVFKRDFGEPEDFNLVPYEDEDPRTGKMIWGVDYAVGKEGYFKRTYRGNRKSREIETHNDGEQELRDGQANSMYQSQLKRMLAVSGGGARKPSLMSIVQKQEALRNKAVDVNSGSEDEEDAKPEQIDDSDEDVETLNAYQSDKQASKARQTKQGRSGGAAAGSRPPIATTLPPLFAVDTKFPKKDDDDCAGLSRSMSLPACRSLPLSPGMLQT